MKSVKQQRIGRCLLEGSKEREVVLREDWSGTVPEHLENLCVEKIERRKRDEYEKEP